MESIRQALILLGRDTVRRWVSVWTLAGLGQRAHPELIAMSAIRARCCEVLGEMVGGDPLGAEGYLVGLCSLLDTMLSCPMETILERVPLSASTRDALLGADTRLRWLLDCTIAYERGDWATCASFATRTGLEVTDVPPAYLDAMQWMRELQQAEERRPGA